VIFLSAGKLKLPLAGWQWRRFFTKWQRPAMYRYRYRYTYVVISIIL